MTTPKIKNTPACMMVSLRDVRVANTLGVCIWFKANEPVLVPGALVDDAAAVGCVPVDATEYEDHKAKLDKAAKAQDELKAKLMAAVDVMVRRNAPEDFTPTGHPKLSVLASEAGVDQKDVSEQLRDHVFAEWRANNRSSIQSKQGSKKAS